MTTRKKLGLGLGTLISLLLSFVIINGLHPQKASAFTPAQINSATFKFTDATTIVMKIAGQPDTQFLYPGSPTTIGIVSFNVFDVQDGYACPTLPPNPAEFSFTTQKTSISIPTVEVNKITSSTTSIQASLAIAIRQNSNCNQSVSRTISVAIPTGVFINGSPTGSVTGTSDACYQSGWAFSWLACPVVTTAQTAANAMYGFVEDQLKFTVLQNCSTPSCADSLGQQHDSVHSAWNNFRILVSGLVVILLLVMVISQAIGTGPFDAYTVRKMLPRLVMGVILIQISWPVFSWIVNTVDHLGVGLADIMYAPFGGAKALDLNTVMQPFTGGTAETFNWIGFIGVAIGAIVAPFLMLGIILTVLVAIFVGFLTLLFRKILIILALIFVPVALIAWMMPNDGLRKYWKLWWDNFIKALMMFPLIIALIAAGRIFAKIGSGQGDIVGFFIVLVGFFGPLFILPKTFKWGGTLMQAAGQGIASAGQKGLKKPKEFLGERQKGYSAERKRQSQERYKNEEGFNIRRPWRRPIDLLRSGQWDPTRFGGQGRIREQAMIGYTAAGAESEQKDIEAANRATQLAIERIHPDEQDAYGRALAAGQKLKIDGNRIRAERYKKDDIMADGKKAYGGELKINKDGSIDGALDATKASLLETRSGLDQITRLGGEKNISYVQAAFERAMDSDDTAQIEMMNKFTTANVQSLFAKLPHMYKNNNYAVKGHHEEHDVVRTVEGLKPEDITSLSGVGMRTLRDNLITRASNESLTADERQKSLAGLQRLTSVFQAAASDPTLRGRIPSDVATAMSELATSRVGKNVKGEDIKIDASWGVDASLDDIASRFNAQGILRETAPPPPAESPGPGEPGHSAPPPPISPAPPPGGGTGEGPNVPPGVPFS